jgi:sporulation protein YlmC with PRC-barrel domain
VRAQFSRRLEHPWRAPVYPDRGASKNQGETAMAMAAEKRETASLIGSDKVEGTNVYRSNGDKIGAIERIMLDKQSGKVAYAVMSFGGFLGIGHDHYPVPWSLLTYNINLGGYEVNISDQQLKGAPSYANDNDWDWEDRKRAQQIYDYYRVPPYWM